MDNNVSVLVTLGRSLRHLGTTVDFLERGVALKAHNSLIEIVFFVFYLATSGVNNCHQEFFFFIIMEDC